MTRMRNLVKRVMESVRERSLIKDGDRVVVAVSGGADSMVLLRCLVEVGRALHLWLVVGHVDHGLRARSAGDALFVAQRAEALGLPFVQKSADVRGRARATGETIEEAGRWLRYLLLKEIAKEVGARVVATGHTATDQAETVLMRVIRGTGPAGVAGLFHARPDGFVRPLLCATREEVRAFALEEGVEFRDDESNLDERYLRNRIRLRLLPLLKELNPRVEHALCGLAEDAAALGSFVFDLVGEHVEGVGNAEVLLRREAVSALDARLRPYLFLKAFELVTGQPLGLSRSHVLLMERLYAGGSNRRVDLPRGVTASRDRKGVWLRRR